MKHTQSIQTLNELIAVSRDGQRGFQTCAEHARDAHLARLFTQRARECCAAIGELEALVRQLGAEPSRHGTRVAAMRRGWIDVRARLRLALDADVVVLEACERGEGHALEVYRNALDDHLPDFVHRVVLRQFEVLMRYHERLLRLRARRHLRVAVAPERQEARS